jgi:hypothetical protein
MSTRTVSSLAALLIFHASAIAQTIVPWGDGAPGTDFIINDPAASITILRGLGQNYKFWAHDGSGTPGTGSINNITIAPGATGDFTLLIDHPTAGQPGALNWRAGDLRYPGGTCTIVGIDLAGSLVTSPGSNPPLDIFCEIVSGNIVAGSISDVGPGSPTLRKFVADSITGNITLGGMRGDIDVGTFNGSLTVGDTPTGGSTVDRDWRCGSGGAIVRRSAMRMEGASCLD